ncbi:MAG: DUF853 family protein [Lachnospiraceae bacterium]|nr:DUF853 family protein [Lachnospiraceae bacterium]
MVKDMRILMGKNAAGKEAVLYPGMANRHGLICGATGSGKTVSLKVMAEGFSSMGVPVFLSDVKGDLSGIAVEGQPSEAVSERLNHLGIEDFSFEGFPVCFWDIFGKTGIPLRTTISEMGPLLLSRILGLTDVQAQILAVVFKIADDEGLLLIDTKDLKSMLAYVSERNKEYEPVYGKMSPQSLSAIIRAVVSIEAEGGDIFFGEPALSVEDWLSVDEKGRGRMHILDASSLIGSPRLYATFLLWMLSELFELLPEVGDLEKPKLVFFFDEAHLLFSGAPKALLEKIEQVVKLVRSKGVGIYFCTQNPADIPGGILSQLGNKIQHALHAYSPAEQKGVRAAAMAYPVNPEFDTKDAILSLGTGEAVVSFLDEQGIPTKALKVQILPPQSSFAPVEAVLRQRLVVIDPLYEKYETPVDPDSAFEFLMRRGMEIEEAKRQAEEEKRLAKEREAQAKQEAKEAEKRAKQEAREAEQRARQEAKEAERAEKAKQKEYENRYRVQKQAIKSVGNTVAGTVGRQVGKELTKNSGSFGKQLAGNVGASVGRGLLSTLLRF